MNLILARHGETQLNKEERFQGIDDEPLNETGRMQAQLLADALAKDMPFYLYTSPVRRAFETAAIISKKVGAAPTAAQGLEELHIGELAGLSGQDMRQRYPEFTQSWSENAAIARLPNGETVAELQKRAWRALMKIRENHPEDTVVVVSHNFTILTIITKVLGLDLRHFRRLKQDLCGITRIELTDTHKLLLSLNETWHLDGQKRNLNRR